MSTNDASVDGIRIIDGDCVTVMGTMGTGTVDLTVTSPPYGDARIYEGYAFDFERIASELHRVTRPGGVLVWVVADTTRNGSESGTSFRQALRFMECGFNLHDTMIYGKNSFMPLTHNRYEQCFEYMFVFSKGRPHTFNPLTVPTATPGSKRYRGGSKAREETYAERKRDARTTVKDEKIRPNIFWYDVGKNDKTMHNAPFPEPLAADHILTWSRAGDLVFDPFTGSGTTAKMAYMNHRRFIGCDVSAAYCAAARQRLAACRPAAP
jgi:site-specific DNA-methyltransferase (adenine-specific)